MLKKVTKRTRNKICANPQGRLLQLIFGKFGGPSRTSKILKLPAYKLSNWLSVGVPHKLHAYIADKLKVDIEGLNYKLHKSLNPKLTWIKVIGMYKFSKEEVRELLKLGEPK